MQTSYQDRQVRVEWRPKCKECGRVLPKGGSRAHFEQTGHNEFVRTRHTENTEFRVPWPISQR